MGVLSIMPNINKVRLNGIDYDINTKLTPGNGISITSAEDGSKIIGLSGARVVISKTEPTVQAGEQVLWVRPT